MRRENTTEFGFARYHVCWRETSSRDPKNKSYLVRVNDLLRTRMKKILAGNCLLSGETLSRNLEKRELVPKIKIKQKRKRLDTKVRVIYSKLCLHFG